ncbi:phosphoenolpyruvate carboxylase type 1 [Kordia periserrulae]|uniref:Phosphoenolpyruvate carboxylase n=1 Tax=Kordia periserrulae TaxID=701523 RepID=A0A2T6BZW3_9FLAO|nr:phosphoenolpyruvate carboxylase [Kordia periserrulae]PTX61598.1 phosphoenolpyruvate carboxylase type 1 [Kordia periserrulae]
MSRKPKLERFQENVSAKYQIYNSIFMTLPFDGISNTGALLPLFSDVCAEGYELDKNPTQIVEKFFERYVNHNKTRAEKNNLLFRFIQYIERQVVLFDAVEDAAFPIVNNMDGRGTLRNLKEEAEEKDKIDDLKEHLKRFKVRPVLTAHPTQFYPGQVLGIITDLSEAIKKDDLLTIKKLLAQLGKTPFFKKKKPTPYDEAVSLIWYLQNVFYHSASKIYDYIQKNIFDDEEVENQVIDLGFWPGGDRDGNPFVTTEITLKVADRLRNTILINYYRDIRKLKRRLTFKGVEQRLERLEHMLYNNVFYQKEDGMLSLAEFEAELKSIRNVVVSDHQSLFVTELDDVINKVKLFGYHFAMLDIRQDSRVHQGVFENIVDTMKNRGEALFSIDYANASEAEKIKVLTHIDASVEADYFDNEITNATISSIYAMKTIQERNGERGANRYIISNNQSALHVMEAFTMLRLCDWKALNVDVSPLFETVPDLQAAQAVMRTLYTNEAYAAHLKRRGNKQYIMLGFSDGTKDGGYLMANWSIFKAKEELTAISREFGIKVIFFDGRGGPPARGGGKTHQFYASLGNTIEDEEIQLTIQGQTISSNFGTLDSCQYNLEQLLSSGISNEIFSGAKPEFSEADKKTMETLASVSYDTYVAFKKHPRFLTYLERMSTLKYYAKTNIGSRPSKRSQSKEFNFSDLRAIPFVGSWSQLKQNVPGFYGVGTALEHMEKNGQFEAVEQLYKNSSFFRTLLANSMMSLTKSFFKLTAYMKDNEEFGEFWSLIFEEFNRTKRMLLQLTGYKTLMENEQAGKASIHAREKIVLPLLTIQQYALRKIHELQKDENTDEKELEVYEKMVTRSLFGNINASRNSA